MASFSDIVKFQRSKGSGVVGSLATAIGQSTLQKIDPRNYLFSRGGTMTSLFPSLKGYQANVSRKTPIEKPVTSVDTMVNKEMMTKINRIEVNSTLIAKNSLVLPAMARDMNLMRLNIQKLVKVSGESVSKKSDMFFKRSAEREAMYESQFKRSDLSGSKVTRTDGKSEDGKGGFLSSIFGFVSSLTSFLPSILKTLLIGGGIAAIIGKLSENPEIKQVMYDTFTNMLSGLFNAIGRGFEFVGTLFENKDVQESLNGAINSFFGMIKKLLDVPLEVGGFQTTIGGALLGLVGALIAFKAAIAAASIALARLAVGGGVGGIGGVAGRVGRSGISRLGIAAAVGAAGYGLYRGMKGGTADGVVGMEGQQLTEEQLSQIKKIEEEQISERKTDIGIQAAVTGVSAAAFGVQAAKGIATKALDVATTPPKGTWGKFLDFVAKKSPKLFAKLGARLATAGAMLAVPGPGWVITLVNLGLSIFSAYELYQLWKEYNSLTTDDQRENAILSDSMGAEIGVVPEIPAPTPVVPKPTPAPEPIPSGSSFADEMGIGMPIAIPTPAPSAPAAPKPTPTRGQMSYGKPTLPPTPAGQLDLKEKIAQGESGGYYDTVYGEKVGTAKINGKPLTQNTIGEVAKWQDSMRSSNRNAAGKYQFMDVRAVAKLAKLSETDLYNAENQEKMYAAYRETNQKYLSSLGVPVSDTTEALAHSVGAGGTKKLFEAAQSGQGNKNAIEVLGLKGEAARTNPHLNKSVNEVIADAAKKVGDTGTMLAGLSKPATAAAGALASIGVSPQQDSTKKTDLMSQMFGLAGDTAKEEMNSMIAAVAASLQSMGSGFQGLGNQITEAMTEVAKSAKQPPVTVAAASVRNDDAMKDWWA